MTLFIDLPLGDEFQEFKELKEEQEEDIPSFYEEIIKKYEKNVAQPSRPRSLSSETIGDTKRTKRITRSFRDPLPEEKILRPAFRTTPPHSPALSRSPSPPLQESTGYSRFCQPNKFKIQDQFCVEDTPENIIFEEDGAIKAATVEKLVQRVTSETKSDPKLVEDFLLTYRSFTTPERLMELLKDRYNTECPEEFSPEETKEFEKKFLLPVRVRVFNLCKNWVKNYNADFMDDPKLEKEFSEWTKDLFDTKKCADLLNILKNVKEQKEEGEHATTNKKKKNQRETQYPKPFLPASVSGAQSIIDFHPTEIARQISLMQMIEYRKIRPMELLNQSWTKENRGAEHVRKMISESTRTSQLISTEVMKVPIKKKTAVISQIFKVAEELMKLNNFNGVMSILAGLSNSAVHRLQPFFREAPKKELKRHLEIVEQLSSDKNFRTMRELIKMAEPPILPYVGTFLTDLTFLEDGNPDKLGDLVNFKKCRLQSQVIRNLLQYQQINYHLEMVPPIQKFLATGMIMDNNVLYQVSLKHLPREQKEVQSIKELEKIQKSSKTGGGGEKSAASEEVQYCPGTMPLEEVISAIENDADLTIVSLCRQEVKKEDMEKVGNLLGTHKNIHTLRLCHGAYADRSMRDGWKWLKKAVHIKTFDLSQQDLAFLPDEIAHMRELTSLSVQQNNIDALPRAISYLENLEELKCEGNKIKEIPDSLSECKKLRSFNISTNKLSSLPKFLVGLDDLKYFYCNDNEIKNIPNELLRQGGPELMQHLKETG